MRMKRILLASSALAVLASVSQAQAASDMYVSVFGGGNFLQDHSVVEAGVTNNVTGYEIDPNTGFVLGGAIGTHLTNWVKGLSVELEASYRRQDIGGNWFRDGDIPITPPTDTTGGSIDGNQSTFAIMANIWYEFDIGTKVRPYIGGGAGWARTRYEAAFITTFTDGVVPVTPTFNDSTSADNSGFAWQLGLGFNYEVAQDVDVGLGYRYFVGPNIGNPYFSNFTGNAPMDNENHAVQVNLTIGIN
ncbi:MAG: porin family protein [Alphaproteobacteria bacterium]|nr:porin family protein [Alphaproteobacteria bacterium]